MKRLLLALALTFGITAAGAQNAPNGGGAMTPNTPPSTGSAVPSGPAGGQLGCTYPNPCLNTGTLAIASGKTLTASNSLTLSGTDGSTLNIGAGGTLGSNAFTSTAYLPLAGGTMSGNIAMGGADITGAGNVSGSGTAQFTTFIGALTGHASLDLPLTGGTLSGALTLSSGNLTVSTGHLVIEGVTSTGATGTGAIVFGTAPSVSSLTVTTAFTATGLVGLPNLATQPNNTALVNATSGAASPTAQAMPSCTGAANALQWLTNTGFQCGTITSVASAVVVGTTTISSGTSNGLLYDNAGVLGNLATVNSGVLVTNGSGVPSISTTLPSGLTAASLTVTGAFTATGLVTNADLANPATTVNGQTCTLGSTCTVAAAAGTLTGTTLASNVVSSSLTSVGTLAGLTVTGSFTATGLVTNADLANSTLTLGSTTLTLGATTTSVAGLTLSTVTVSSGTLADITGFGLRDTSAAFDLTIGATSSTALTAGRTLTFDVVNAARTVKLGANLTIASDPGAVTGALKSNGTGTFAQAAASDLSNGTTGSGAVVLATSPTIASPTFSGTVAGAGTIPNSVLVNSATTVNGQTCTLGSTCTVAAAAGTLTGTTLASNVVTSSLTTVGTIGTGVWQGTLVGGTYGGTGVNNGASTLTLAASVTHAGAFATTITATNVTNSTLPAGTHTLAGLDVAQTWTAAQTFTNSDILLLGSSTGATTFTSDNAGASNFTLHVPAANDTIAALAATQALTNKTYNGNTWTAGTGTLTIGAGKTATLSNTVTITATDGSTLAVGAGGTLQSVAYSGSASDLGSGTVAAARGGAGTINGALKANGSGVVSQAATTDLSDVTASSTAWTPTDGSGATLTFTSVSAAYTKVGNMVFAYGVLIYPTTGDVSNTRINGLPISVPAASYARTCSITYTTATSANASYIVLNNSATTFDIYTSAGARNTNAQMNAAVLRFLCIYPAS